MREDVAALLGSRTMVPFRPREASGLGVEMLTEMESRHQTHGAPCTALPAASHACKSKFMDRPLQSPQSTWIQSLRFVPSVASHCCWDFFFFFFFLTINVTGELLSFLREHRGRNKGPALLRRTSLSSCCFWQLPSLPAQGRRHRTTFYLSFPPQESLIYHSSAPARTAIFVNIMNLANS